MKRQATDWEKIFAVHIINKGPVSRILSTLNRKNMDNTNKKWTNNQQTEMASEKTLNTISHQRNAKQNHSDENVLNLRLW